MGWIKLAEANAIYGCGYSIVRSGHAKKVKGAWYVNEYYASKYLWTKLGDLGQALGVKTRNSSIILNKYLGGDDRGIEKVGGVLRVEPKKEADIRAWAECRVARGGSYDTAGMATSRDAANVMGCAVKTAKAHIRFGMKHVKVKGTYFVGWPVLHAYAEGYKFAKGEIGGFVIPERCGCGITLQDQSKGRKGVLSHRGECVWCAMERKQ